MKHLNQDIIAVIAGMIGGALVFLIESAWYWIMDKWRNRKAKP